MDDRSVSLNYYLSKEYRDPPKAFWKYYDLYRREPITLDEDAVLSNDRIGPLRDLPLSSCYYGEKAKKH